MKWWDFGALFTPSEKTKLTGIEDSATADQTNTEIRDAVESATNSNTFTDADHTKLNGIDTGAKDDQTGAEIKTAYEAEANAYTDTKNTKLAGIDTGADVTGANPPQSHGAGSHTNRTRSIPFFTSYYHSGTQVSQGITLSPTVDQTCFYRFMLPKDYVAGTNLYLFFQGLATGNIVLDVKVYYGTEGEAYSAHSNSDYTNIINIGTANVIQKFTTAGLLAGLDTSDVITIRINRDADHASDTNTSDIHFIGGILEYEADM